MSAADWTRVRPANPCPICAHDSWCSISSDGAVVACMRVAEGAFRTKETDAGTQHMHRMGAAPALFPLKVSKPHRDPEIADPGTLDIVYRDLLNALKLASKHRDDLRRRGLTDAVIDRSGYRSLPVQGRARVAGSLLDRHGDVVHRVPGIGVKGGKLTVLGPAGLLVPVRDIDGRIVALKVRRDGDEDGAKYVYLSSKKAGGPGPGAPVHVPHRDGLSASICRITEGEIKADVATALSGTPTISVPGVGNWRPAVDVVEKIGAKKVLLSFDADAWSNPHVGRHLSECFRVLRGKGLDVAIEKWPAEAGKGIDDLLAADGIPEVLEGDVAAAEIDRLMAVLAVPAVSPEGEGLDDQEIIEIVRDGGAAALYRDERAMVWLSELSMDDRTEFEAVKDSLLHTGVKAKALKGALQPFIAERRRERRKSKDHRSVGFAVIDGTVCRLKPTEDGEVPHPLCNFDARIIEEVTSDDGVETQVALVLEGALDSGLPLPKVEIPATAFAGMAWVVSNWGSGAIICAGLSTRDQLREGIQRLSTEVTRRKVFTHTGWTVIENEWLYLSSVGAIGKDGLKEGVEVRLQGAVERYSIPKPLDGDDVLAAVRASLRLLDGLAPDPIVFALLAATYRAPLGPCDMSLHVSGKTGSFKTELAVLFLRHYGVTFDRKNLPATWQSTGNALEMAAFSTKDALIVIDEFVPTGGSMDRQRLQQVAERVFRAQGNGSGRQRCRTDGSLRTAKPPRGLILSCGEESPQGQSLRARVLLLELRKDDVDVERLTECQRDSGLGHYAVAMACYLKWLAPRMSSISRNLDGRIAQIRENWHGLGGHRRTATNLATLYAGLLAFFEFAVEAGAITYEQREELVGRAERAFAMIAESQAGEIRDAEPTEQYLRLLATALSTGRAHLLAVDDATPISELAAWGWRSDPTTSHPRPMGSMIGWIDGDDVFLQPDTAFAEAQKLAREQGEQLAVAPRTLHRHLRDRGLLITVDAARDRLVVRRVIRGVEQKILHLAAATILKTNGQNGQFASGGGIGDPDDDWCASETASSGVNTARLAASADETASRNVSTEKDFPSNGRSGRLDQDVEARAAQEKERSVSEDGWQS